MKTNKMYIICPFSEMEAFIKERRHLLAKLYINDHFREIKNSTILRPLFTKCRIKLRGMVTNRLNNYKESLNFM